MTLTKNSLAANIHERVYGVSAREALHLLDRVLEIIKDTLVGGEDVLISGFGKFVVRRKGSRRGRNPQTGDSLLLRKRQVVVFRPSTTLRVKLNPPVADRDGQDELPDVVAVHNRGWK